MKNPTDLPAGNVPQWTLGDRLRKARTTAGIERPDMADDIGCTERTISSYELDQTRVPKLVIRQYALRTGVPLEWLRGEIYHPEGDHIPVTIREDDVSGPLVAALVAA